MGFKINKKKKKDNQVEEGLSETNNVREKPKREEKHPDSFEHKLKFVEIASVVLQTIFAGFLLWVGYLQWETSDKQADVMKKQEEIMKDQTTILSQQKDIMEVQGNNSERLSKSQIDLIKEQNKLFDKQTKIAIEPQINCRFIIELDKKYYALEINNDGTSDIVDLEIWKEIKVYDLINRGASRSDSAFSWKSQNKVKSGATLKYRINPFDLENAWRQAVVDSSVSSGKIRVANSSISTGKIREELFPAILFKISYKKDGDRKEYRIKKYLFLVNGNINGQKEIVGYDPEESMGDPGEDILFKEIEKLEKRYPWKTRLPFSIPTKK